MSRCHCGSGSKGDPKIFPGEHPKGHCKPSHKLRLPVPISQRQWRIHHYGLRRRGAVQVTLPALSLEHICCCLFPCPKSWTSEPLGKENLVWLSVHLLNGIWRGDKTLCRHRNLGLACIGLYSLCMPVSGITGCLHYVGCSWWKAP